MYEQEEQKTTTKVPLVGVFTALDETILVGRKLCQVGIGEGQIEIIDPMQPSAKSNAKLHTRTKLSPGGKRLSSKDPLDEQVSLKRINSSDIGDYLYDTGIPEEIAAVYEERAREGECLLIAHPEKEHLAQAEALIYQASSLMNGSRGK